MGFSLDISVPILTVFVQGLLSFFSPCVLPLIPLYIGYLAGGTRKVGEDGKVYFSRKKVMVNTLFFVVGVSFTFFLLGFGASVLGSFFKGSQSMFARIGGILIVVFGFYQLGVFGKSKALSQEHRLPFHLDKLAMSPWTALIMGFTFSFAWTPCVGPALSSVLLMSASASTKLWGFALIGVYTLGFVLPFLAVGIFSTTLLDLFKKHNNVVKYTVKVGGVLMILMGLMMFTGKMNAITGYLSEVQTAQQDNTKTEKQVPENEEKSAGDAAEKKDKAQNNDSNTKDNTDKNDDSKQGSVTELPDAIDFELKDQYGNVHKLSDYKGKTVFLNFWATWCPPCRAEMPEIQKLYEEYQKEEDPEVVILGIAAPGYGQEQSADGVKQFLEENGYTYPVLMDEGGNIFDQYGIQSYPTTFMITKEGKVFGYLSGQLSEDIMRNIIAQTISGKRETN
ncbi:cytochrome C biogenesis protein [Eubacterium sp. am_0171]|uniref:Thiol-disulfide oxidoreductase resA n=1 Tax=Faecalicatena contorta TaxID=39482 RepID=A0A174N6V4_9FIRM|nr:MULTISPECIES: cytochrome c biogenesis protein/redoxin [Clostridia]MSC85428.1 redoxin domain-containing protein [Eubacterium sp. BIOML-A1]MSD07915.1 redoxin domain-containing protein [Eubacterium sp. BIOML-A2]RYT11050.1 cytochrome C biogenesis protein [Eubacterium sp. am_0171]CUP41679.1 Thiol-disulfide oxidoreductase resA [[Eubacterium] contortum] [Faecalicatena contorta]